MPAETRRCAGVIHAAVKFSMASISYCCSKLIHYLDAKEKEREYFGFAVPNFCTSIVVGVALP